MRLWIDPQAPTSAMSDIAFLLFRILVGTFLIWGVWDNIISAERMSEFSGFLQANGFAYPHIMAPISVYAQFICGAGILFGVFTRWVGILCAINFIVALIMVDLQGGFRQAFPAAMLVMFGLYIAARGAGRLSLENYVSSLRKRE